MVMVGTPVNPTGIVSCEWFPEVQHDRTGPLEFMAEQLA